MKTGRNDPCPCGSGKKYKKCCANRSAPSMLQDMKEDIHGLADLEQISEGPINREYRVRSTSLSEKIVQWHL